MGILRRRSVDPWSVFFVLVIVGVVLAWPASVLVRDHLHSGQEAEVLARWSRVYDDCTAAGTVDCSGVVYSGCVDDPYWQYSPLAGAVGDETSYATSVCGGPARS